jgi:Fe-S cluster assembly ATP-binding protein
MTGHTFIVEDLHASVGGRDVLHGIDLEVKSGEVHVVMGPNGSGKSTLAHALMGRPGTTVTSGSIRMDGQELVGRPAWERARAGLFLALQNPVEVPGVGLRALLRAAGDGAPALNGADGATLDERLIAEAAAVGLEPSLLTRPLNVDLSGGEKKRAEMVQLGVLQPALCILDEIDSGLDVDALGDVARRLQLATLEWQVGILAITHFHRFLVELEADMVHVISRVRVGTVDLYGERSSTGRRAESLPSSRASQGCQREWTRGPRSAAKWWSRRRSCRGCAR